MLITFICLVQRCLKVVNRWMALLVAKKMLRFPLFAGTDDMLCAQSPQGSAALLRSKAVMPVLGTPGQDVLVGGDEDDRLEGLEGMTS